MFLLERFFCCLWGCGSVLIVDSAVPVCSLSVCICTLKFWEEKIMIIIITYRISEAFPSACTLKFTPWPPVVTHWSPRLYISCFLAQSHTWTHRRDTHMHVYTCWGYIQPDTHKHTHTRRHTLSLYLCSPCFHRFSCHFAAPEKGGRGGGVGEGITMCDAASGTTRPEFQIKHTPLFF